jgi:peroxiredoxin
MITGLPIGSTAPDFVLPRSPSREYRLSDYRGKRHVVVSFLALAFTGGTDWGVEGTLRAFQRDWADFDAFGAQILTITADSMYANEAFGRSIGGLWFPILADFLPRGAVSREWNCWSEDREHPRNVTLIIDREGVVRSSEHHRKGGVPDNGALLEVLDSLGE